MYSPANATNNPPRYLVADGVAIYGGFVGSETTRDERDWLENLTILSGDIDGNDSEPIATRPNDIQGNNTGPILEATGAGTGTRLDGFTVTAGTGGSGSGMVIANGDGMVVENVDFIGNFSSANGGGVLADDAIAKFRNVRFLFNEAQRGGGLRLLGPDSFVTLVNTTFQENSSDNNGGAIYSNGNGFSAVNVRFLGNESNEGGAITCNNCTIEIANGEFVNNQGNRGGLMQNVAGGLVTMTNIIA